MRAKASLVELTSNFQNIEAAYAELLEEITVVQAPTRVTIRERRTRRTLAVFEMSPMPQIPEATAKQIVGDFWAEQPSGWQLDNIALKYRGKSLPPDMNVTLFNEVWVDCSNKVNDQQDCSLLPDCL